MPNEMMRRGGCGRWCRRSCRRRPCPRESRPRRFRGSRSSAAATAAGRRPPRSWPCRRGARRGPSWSGSSAFRPLRWRQAPGCGGTTWAPRAVARPSPTAAILPSVADPARLLKRPSRSNTLQCQAQPARRPVALPAALQRGRRAPRAGPARRPVTGACGPTTRPVSLRHHENRAGSARCRADGPVKRGRVRRRRRAPRPMMTGMEAAHQVRDQAAPRMADGYRSRRAPSPRRPRGPPARASRAVAGRSADPRQTGRSPAAEQLDGAGPTPAGAGSTRRARRPAPRRRSSRPGLASRVISATTSAGDGTVASSVRAWTRSKAASGRPVRRASPSSDRHVPEPRRRTARPPPRAPRRRPRRRPCPDGETAADSRPRIPLGPHPRSDRGLAGPEPDPGEQRLGLRPQFLGLPPQPGGLLLVGAERVHLASAVVTHAHAIVPRRDFPAANR